MPSSNFPEICDAVVILRIRTYSSSSLVYNKFTWTIHIAQQVGNSLRLAAGYSY